jgi:tetratricopeptide (TPR) repeat protein
MMARFDKLEFGSTPKKETRDTEELAALKDEKHWFQLADGHRRTGHYENALRFYSRSLEMDRSQVAAWVGQVQMLIQLKEYPQARLWSQKALELFPSNSELMAAGAQAECRMGNNKQALVLSDGALQQTGESAYQWQVRGELMVARKGRTDRHCFDKAQLADRDWLVPLETGLIYCFYKAFSKGQGRLQQAVEGAPDAYYAWYQLGCCQTKIGLAHAAGQSFHRCLELCPRHVEAGQRLAELDRPQWPFVRVFRRLMGR